ncbi:Protein of unknown function [Pelagirhabdus alkalitolerans]|uniref:DUF4127 family protein n=1 Tax=Pelagirhabdus alkalitolerans TaxID=1612202 RepID=A0A1G6LGA9_9BACI|nr:DUF4127 family protein [Pelagirhabdus alkalitolerans]SDC42318.1 Protein of unknown function [Pelagirhabdus alkalitolerans]
MRCAYVPIDERPCNTRLIDQLVATNDQLDILTVEKSMLGYKKKRANTQKIWDWLFQIEQVDGMVLSAEMLLYGGLIPSRIHELSEEDQDQFEKNMRRLKEKNPHTKMYASSIIMRTPQYSSSDEEPDYYADFGYELFTRAYLQDKKNREYLTTEEIDQLDEFVRKLPEDIVSDYESRRAFNSSVNELMLTLLAEGIIDTLVIPQDDSAEYGYTAIDQKKVLRKIAELNLESQVLMYPGSDEVGSTLVTRFFNDQSKQTPTVAVEWSSTLGPSLIPMYEDRPFNETLKRHIRAIGAKQIDDKPQADIVLFYNVPGKNMQESWDQFTAKDPTYDAFREMVTFVDRIEEAIESGYRVAIADCAYSNGGDYVLLKLLDERCLIPKVVSYKGWNTNANTLGTTLAQGILATQTQSRAIDQNLYYHVLDDFLYQAIIRKDITDHVLPQCQLTYFDLKDHKRMINQMIDQRLVEEHKKYLPNHYKATKAYKVTSDSPWNRMFEVDFMITDTNERSGGVE